MSADFFASAREAKAQRREALHRALSGATADDGQGSDEQATDVHEQAASDFDRLAAIGLVIRDDLPADAVRAWRDALVGLGQRAGVKIDTGVLKDGSAWAGLSDDDGAPE